MIDVFFYLTEAMIADKRLLEGFRVQKNGRNVYVIVDDGDVESLQKLINRVEKFGCSLQMECDSQPTDNPDLLEILREYGCV